MTIGPPTHPTQSTKHKIGQRMKINEVDGKLKKAILAGWAVKVHPLESEVGTVILKGESLIAAGVQIHERDSMAEADAMMVMWYVGT